MSAGFESRCHNHIDTGFLTRHHPAELIAADPRRDPPHALADQAARRSEAAVLGSVPFGLPGQAVRAASSALEIDSKRRLDLRSFSTPCGHSRCFCAGRDHSDGRRNLLKPRSVANRPVWPFEVKIWLVPNPRLSN